MKPRDAGSILPLTLLSVLLALLLIAGTATASSAFVAQRDLQAWCDTAALSAVENAQVSSLYADVGPGPLSTEAAEGAAETALERYRDETQDLNTVTELSVQDDRLTVLCTRTVGVPFGRLFGVSGGLRRQAVSSARVHWSA
jgi:hypothetical protein